MNTRQVDEKETVNQLEILLSGSEQTVFRHEYVDAENVLWSRKPPSGYGLTQIDCEFNEADRFRLSPLAGADSLPCPADTIMLTFSNFANAQMSAKKGLYIDTSEDDTFEQIYRLAVETKSQSYARLEPIVQTRIPQRATTRTYRYVRKPLIRQPVSQLSKPFSDDKHELDWVYDPELLLSRLENKSFSADDELLAIVFSESLPVKGKQLSRLLAMLEDWIEKNRFSDHGKKVTATCAAVRKYALNMDSNKFQRYAGWIEPSSSARVPLDVELELTKGVYSRLRFISEEVSPDLPALQSAVASVATDYLRARILLDKNHASIAKYAILACMLIDARSGTTKSTQTLWEAKSQLVMSWFDRLIDFEARKAINSIFKRDPEFAKSVEHLWTTLKRER